MKFLKLLPVIISFLLLGAHFYRSGLTLLTILCLAILFLLFVRQAWVPRLFQILLVLGSIEWLRSLYAFAAMRIAWDQPWTRLAVILIGVALFTALSGLVLKNSKLQESYIPKSH